jgi:hypothetical protein
MVYVSRYQRYDREPRERITDSEESHAIDNFGKTEVSNFDGRGIFRSKEHVLSNRYSQWNQQPEERHYLRLQVTVCNPFAMNVL